MKGNLEMVIIMRHQGRVPVFVNKTIWGRYHSGKVVRNFTIFVQFTSCHGVTFLNTVLPLAFSIARQ